jgi:hypothetical protein
MAKCRRLITENEELGKMVEAGRLARLEGELAMTRKEADQLKNGQSGSCRLLPFSSVGGADSLLLRPTAAVVVSSTRRSRSTAWTR